MGTLDEVLVDDAPLHFGGVAVFVEVVVDLLERGQIHASLRRFLIDIRELPPAVVEEHEAVGRIGVADAPHHQAQEIGLAEFFLAVDRDGVDVAHIDCDRLVVVVVESHHGIGRVEVVLVVFREELVKVFLGQVAVEGGELLGFDGDVRKTLPQHGQISLLVAEGQEDLHFARLAVDDGDSSARAAHRLADAHAEDVDIFIRGALEGEAAVKAAEHTAHAAREVRRGKDERQSL